ncbi:cupin domain-containing protein [Vogesella sp. LIG4]|uniref:cupin domain-containing protein n=1 Tax=Vogesella sp. LIG4 TaxID=1192162 RepID=UPI00081FA6C3|nr:cupin domain-containing protein [Vogesella sp. LIG4]SCK29772.1 hypothetical protein PSELUDRAFT_3675 [Vogesella sp. LIG4]
MQEQNLLLANHCLAAASLALDYHDLPAAQTIAGQPRVGTALLGSLGGCNIGVWEMSPSISTDVESDEFFIVLFGDATVSFADGSPELQLSAGSVGHLRAGTATTWTVRQTLRKVYIA